MAGNFRIYFYFCGSYVSLTYSATGMSLATTAHVCHADQQIMVPLTESLYVAGHVHQKDTLLVDIGTGYYAEVCF